MGRWKQNCLGGKTLVFVFLGNTSRESPWEASFVGDFLKLIVSFRISKTNTWRSTTIFSGS